MHRDYFDADHDAFRDSVRRYLAREVVPQQTQWEAAGMVPREAWRGLGEQGFLLTWLEESLGGTGLADFRFEQVVLVELAAINEMGRFVGLQSSTVAPYITRFGSADQ